MAQQPEIFEKRFKETDVCGMCYPDGRIAIDPRQLPPDYLETLVHELLHRELPDLSEEAVERVAPRIAKALWSQNYRRIYA